MSQQPPAPSQPPPPDQPPGGQSWPGPPSTWPGGPGGAEPASGGGAPPGHGHGGAPDGPPPPPWRRRRRRWLIALAVVGALIVIGVPLGFGIAALSSAARDIDLTSPTPDETGPPDEAPQRPEVEVEVPDLDDLDGVDAELGQVLVHVNEAEEQMLATQERFAIIFEEAASPAAQDPMDDLLDALSEAAGEGQRELQAIRRELTSVSVDDGDVREIRDRYLAHLDAWVRYLVAVEDDPTLLAGGGGDEAFMLSINTTAEAFARAVREDLPEDVDERVRTFAERIVERGFSGSELSPDDTV